MNDFRFHFASLYQERGYSVIPMRDGRPAIDWAPFRERRASLPQIAIWFGAAARKEYDIGIVTGSVSDLVVVSAETDYHARFDSSLIAERRPERLDFYFRKGKTNVATKQLAGLQVHGDGGIVPAPSHPDQWLSWLEPYSADDVPVYASVLSEIASLLEGVG